MVQALDPASATAQPRRVLRLDPRPPTYDSVAEASFEGAQQVVVRTDVETADWSPIVPPRPARRPSLAFVDGVQRLEMRLSAEGDGWPLPGILASYAAGAVCVEPRESPLPGLPPAGVCDIHLGRNVILAGGATTHPIVLSADNGEVVYQPAHCIRPDFEGLQQTLGDLRARLEADRVRELMDAGVELVIADGRLPDIRQGPVVGLIKTLATMYIVDQAHVECVMRLRAGERSPLFTIQRARSTYYSWFVCLRNPRPYDVSLSGLARLEMDDYTSCEDVRRVADLTAAILPEYASSPDRDARAPQNLLPVGFLERELRRHLGELEYLKRLMATSFQKDTPWTP